MAKLPLKNVGVLTIEEENRNEEVSPSNLNRRARSHNSAFARLGDRNGSEASLTPSQQDLRDKLRTARAEKAVLNNNDKNKAQGSPLTPLTPEQIQKRNLALAERQKLVEELMSINDAKLELCDIEANGGTPAPEGSTRFLSGGKAKTIASQARGTKRAFIPEIPVINLEPQFQEEEDRVEEGSEGESTPKKVKAQVTTRGKEKEFVTPQKKTNAHSGEITPGMMELIKKLIEGQNAPTSCSRSMDAFSDEIVNHPIQKGKPPTASFAYNGSTSARSHMGQFEGQMALFSSEEAVMCKALAATFTGKALDWIMSQEPRSIKSFGQFRTAFLNEFAGAGERLRPKSDLLKIRQEEGEPTSSYVQRFRKTTEKILNLSQGDILLCFEGGLTSGFLKMDFASSRPKSVEEMYERAIAIAGAEDPGENNYLRRSVKDRIGQGNEVGQGSSFRNGQGKNRVRSTERFKRLDEQELTPLNAPRAAILKTIELPAPFPLQRKPG